jgi:hypothetical protein
MNSAGMTYALLVAAFLFFSVVFVGYFKFGLINDQCV